MNGLLGRTCEAGVWKTQWPEDGTKFYDTCDEPAVTWKTDPDGQSESPVCADHA